MIDEAIVIFDIDDTLIYEHNGLSAYYKDPEIMISYNGRIELRCPHTKHINLLKDNHARGFTIYLWSGNGRMWCAAVAKALNIEQYVHHMMAKPIKLIDDLDPSEWLPKRIYLENK